ncbi:MAG: hypothetical protein JW829_18805, partial [Pirellulales bacterium]|nr:hypothetical protein [Pirellulales bacterium]
MSTQQQQVKARTKRRRRRVATTRRRGVLLLVVLSILIIFLMTAITFVLVTKHAEKASKASNRGSINAVNRAAQQRLLDDVLLQVVRDTLNPYSSLRCHSLMRDMYGVDGFFAQVQDRKDGNGIDPPQEWRPKWAQNNPLNINSNGQPVTNGQIIEFALDMDAGLMDLYYVPYFVSQVSDWWNNKSPLSRLDDAYNGQVLTFLGGKARGQSTRIVGYLPADPVNETPPILRILNFKLPDSSMLTDPTILEGARFLVNGRPFNGTGVGFNPTLATNYPGARLNAKELVTCGADDFQLELALLPNTKYFYPPAGYSPANSDDYGGWGGCDESYDIPDFQNMLLALMPRDPVEGPGNSSGLGDMVLPSLHRPALINYWRQYWEIQSQNIGLDSLKLENNYDVLRKVLLRPNWLDHPNFTGSNWAYSAAQNTTERLDKMIYGPWDVDNDNDGVHDSIWVDFGAPIITMPDGTRVKPLAAILCLDMDGRLNVNAHGTIDLAGRQINDPAVERTPPPPQQLAGSTPGNTILSWILPRGSGYGPGDISLEPLL